MKKRFVWLLALAAALCCLWCAAGAETVTFQGKVTAETTAEALDMGKIRVTDLEAFVGFLKKLPNLKKVDMFATRVKGAWIDRLAAEFPQIEFGWTMRIGDHDVRTDATAFSTLHNNSSPPHTQADFKYLKYCKNMVALDIGHNRVTDVSFLYDMPQLKYLILACNINLTDITPVGSLQELEYLELFKNRINDISCLQNCKNLIDLNLCFNSISDYSSLTGLDKLERLWLYNSNNWNEKDPVPAETMAALRTALPGCYLDSTSYSTDGGWRTHDRYYVIYHTFKNGVYTPFDQAAQIAPLYRKDK